MKTKEEIIGRKKTVKIAILGKLPSKKINPSTGYSDWGLSVGLINYKTTEIQVDKFDPQDYNLIIIDGAVLLKEIDY